MLLLRTKLSLEMKKIRQLHSYLGVLFAPSIIFFALSGAFQTFRWQKTVRRAPRHRFWLEWQPFIKIKPWEAGKLQLKPQQTLPNHGVKRRQSQTKKRGVARRRFH